MSRSRDVAQAAIEEWERVELAKWSDEDPVHALEVIRTTLAWHGAKLGAELLGLKAAFYDALPFRRFLRRCPHDETVPTLIVDSQTWGPRICRRCGEGVPDREVEEATDFSARQASQLRGLK